MSEGPREAHVIAMPNALMLKTPLRVYYTSLPIMKCMFYLFMYGYTSNGINSNSVKGKDAFPGIGRV